MDKPTRQIIAFHVSDRSRKSARQLWANLPAVSREQATLYTEALSKLSCGKFVTELSEARPLRPLSPVLSYH
jgi:hypothetical protein